MSVFEIISLCISAISAICVVFGTWFGLRNLRLIASSHSDNHEWNRRLATQNALKGIRSLNTDLLNKEFGYADLMTSIPLDTVLKKFDEQRELQNLCHEVLNWYEGLASGIHLGIYDDLAVKVNRQGPLEKNFANWREYIIYRRDLVSKKAWAEQEKLIQKWRNDALSESDQARTGSI